MKPPATSNGSRLTPEQSNFHNPGVLVQSWYAIARSREVKMGRLRSFDLSNRRIALYRGGARTVHALDARCPHLGADLSHGSVTENGVRCAFHGWRIGSDGRCKHAPGLEYVPQRGVRSYPVAERWGFVWLFNGPRPLFELPATPDRLRSVRLPSRTIRCHPHLVVGNGLDATHFETLHDVEFTSAPRLVVEDRFRISLEMRGRPRRTYLRRLVAGEMYARFTTIGASLAWAEVFEPVRSIVTRFASPSEALNESCLPATRAWPAKASTGSAPDRPRIRAARARVCVRCDPDIAVHQPRAAPKVAGRPGRLRSPPPHARPADRQPRRARRGPRARRALRA